MARIATCATTCGIHVGRMTNIVPSMPKLPSAKAGNTLTYGTASHPSNSPIALYTSHPMVHRRWQASLAKRYFRQRCADVIAIYDADTVDLFRIVCTISSSGSTNQGLMEAIYFANSYEVNCFAPFCLRFLYNLLRQ
jgi:hypothetical protein